MWVALRDQKSAGRLVRAGEPIPEAANWPLRDNWVRAKYVVWVPDPAPTPCLATVAPREPESEPSPEVEVLASPPPPAEEIPVRRKKRGSKPRA